MHNHNDLQATQFVISLFEKSKAQSESSLEALPGIYAVVSDNGEILKGNKKLAEIFDVNLENLLGLNFFDLISKEKKEKLFLVLKDVNQKSISEKDLKVEILSKSKKKFNYIIDVLPVKIERVDSPNLAVIVGRDVTDLTFAIQEKSRMEMELSTARTVQERLFLPPSARFEKTSLSGFYEPATECGGDWWHYCMMKDRLFLWIGDVTGHGVPSALVVSAVNAAVSTLSGSAMTPANALAVLNRIVYTTAKNHLAMTFFIASIDLKKFSCTYASAGHEPVFLFSKGVESYKAKDIIMLEADPGVPLGINQEQKYKEQTVQLSKGDRLFLYTDGLKDVSDRNGNKWQNLQLLRVLAPLASEFRGAENLTEALKKEIENFRQGTLLSDDVTFFTYSID